MAKTTKGEIPEVLPRGPHGLAPEVVASSQRSRLLAAVVEVVAEQGYAKTTVADVIARAGVSRKTFYVHFKDKADCFIAAFDEGRARLIDQIVGATLAVESPDEQLRAGYQALCEGLADDPALAECFVVIAPEAGQLAQAKRDEWREASIERLRWLYELAAKQNGGLPEKLSESRARAIVGAVEALIAHHVQVEGATTLPELVPTIVEVAEALMFTKR